MSDRITIVHLRRALTHLHEVAGVSEPTFELEAYSSGRGTCYRITNATQSVNLFGDRYWIGASEAYFGIHSIAKAIRWARENAPEVVR